MAIERIYKDGANRDKIFGYIIKRGGQVEDAKDIYQDASIRFLRKVTHESEFRIESSVKNYLFGICKMRWLEVYRKRSREIPTDSPVGNETSSDMNVHRIVEINSRDQMLKQLVSELDGKCKDILTMWMHSYSMKEIPMSLDYSSELMARKAKYRCIKRLKAIIGSKPELEKMLAV